MFSIRISEYEGAGEMGNTRGGWTTLTFRPSRPSFGYLYVARAPTRVFVCGGQETARKGNGDYGARDGGDDDDHGSLIADGRRGGFGRWTMDDDR